MLSGFLISIFIFIFGTIIGSFLNVVIYRFNTGMGLGGRSRCFSCRRNLEWFELIPILSFILQHGRCRKCSTQLAIQYLLVEFITGVLFLASFWRFLPAVNVFNMSSDLFLNLNLELIFNTIFVWVIMSILIVITVYDLRHKIIPDLFSYTLAVLSFLRIFIGFNYEGVFLIMFPDMLAIFAGPILALPFYLLWIVSGGKWMGLGDAKLSLGIGWFLSAYFPLISPIVLGLAVFLYAFWGGTAFFLLLAITGFTFKSLSYVFRKIFGNVFVNFPISIPKIGIRSEIPFAPFLIAGLLVVFLLRYNILEYIASGYIGG